MMKRAIQIATLVGLLAPLVFAACPEQTYPGIPAGVDINRIAVNPASPTGERLYLGRSVVLVGQLATYEGYACDPEGQPMSVTVDNGAIDVNTADYTYRLSYVPVQAGTKYVNVRAEDTVLEDSPLSNADDPKVAMGTWVVVAISENKGPVLCGGRP